MQDNLKNYIDTNRAAFDCVEAPDVWTGIQAGLKPSIPTVKPKSISNMIKYGFGASVVVVSTSIALFTLGGKTGNTLANEKTKNVAARQVEIIQPSSITIQNVDERKMQEPVQEKKRPIETETEFNIDTVENETEYSANVKPGVFPALIAKVDSVRQIADPHKVDTLFKNVTKIEVECKFINVGINSTEADAVKLQGEIHQYACENLARGKNSNKKSAYFYRYKQEKGVLRVWIENSKTDRVLAELDEKEGPSYLNLEVPNGVDLDIKNSSGSISLTGCKTDIINLKTQFGSIKLDDASGNIKLLASSGAIKGSQLSGTINCNSNFGNVHLNKITGIVSIQSSSGAASIEDLTGDANVITTFGSQKYHNIIGNIDATATSGSIKVFKQNGKLTSSSSFGSHVFEGIVGDIKADASSGTIKISGTKGKLDLSTTFGSIKGADVRLLGDCQFKASSGNINIDFLNDFKELKFDLRSSSGMISVGEGELKTKSDRTLQLGDGNILISGVSSFGSQNYH